MIPSLQLAMAGCGNMARAFGEGINLSHPIPHWFLYTPTQHRAKQLAEEWGGKVVARPEELLVCEGLILAMKPQSFLNSTDWPKLGPKLGPQKWVLSLMATVKETKLKDSFPEAHVIRCMPNLACALGQGVTLISWPKVLPPEIRLKVLSLLENTGEIFEVGEEELDFLILLSACGPGYLAYISSLVSDYFGRSIHNPALLKAIMAQTLKGTGALLEGGGEFEEVMQSVASKGGVTEAILQKLKSENLSQIFAKAFDHARERGKNLPPTGPQ